MKTEAPSPSETLVSIYRMSQPEQSPVWKPGNLYTVCSGKLPKEEIDLNFWVATNSEKWYNTIKLAS